GRRGRPTPARRRAPIHRTGPASDPGPHRSRGAANRSSMDHQRAPAALEASGLAFPPPPHGPVPPLAAPPAAGGVQARDVPETLVVRRSAGEYLFALVAGDREISWPKLRALLGVDRLSMPDQDGAKEAAGYERGTITPFGSTTAWPVIADASLSGDRERTISLGAGEHGVAATVNAEAALAHLEAQVADITELQES